MTNLNKNTKAELITKINWLKIHNKPTLFSKFLGFILLIKIFILKFTLLAVILRIFKRFSLLRRLFIILNTIVMSIFGISMLDIYGLTFLSALITEISFITGNIVAYLTNTHFYSIISGLFGYKVETPTKLIPLNRNDKGSTGISTQLKENSKISEWFNQVDKQEDTPFYKNKYFIYGSFLLISCVTYYYFGDEIKVYSISLWHWLRGRGPEDGNNNINPNPTNRMNWIESAIAYGNINDLDQESLNKLQGKATEIAIAYNSFAESFEKNRDKFDNDTAQPLKDFGF